jgi:DNA-binding transcriptional LysR family regulator
MLLAGGNGMALDLRLVLHFAAVAEELSFTRAAARLRVPQPWLSTRIRQLEVQLGVPLLNRSTRRVELTQEGQALLDCSRPLQKAAQTLEAFAAAHGQCADRLRVGMPPYGSRIPERIALINEFAAGWPKTSIELDIGWTLVLLDRLRQGLLDAAFVIGVTLPSDLETLTICSTGLQLLLDPTDELAELPKVSVDQLRDRRVAVFTRGLNPEMYDRLFEPVAHAGGHLVQMPNVMDVQENGTVYPSDLIVAQFGWSAPYAARQWGRITRPMRLEQGSVPLQLVRRREMPRRAASRLWDLAQSRAVPV